MRRRSVLHDTASVPRLGIESPTYFSDRRFQEDLSPPLAPRYMPPRNYTTATGYAIPTGETGDLWLHHDPGPLSSSLRGSASSGVLPVNSSTPPMARGIMPPGVFTMQHRALRRHGDYGSPDSPTRPPT